MTSLDNSGQLLTTKLHTLFHLLVLPLKRKDIAAPPRTSYHKEEIATLLCTSLDLITWTIYYYYYYVHTCYYDIMVGWLVGSQVKAKGRFISKKVNCGPMGPTTT